MKKAGLLFKSFVVKDYNLGKFVAFFQANEKIFEEEVFVRLISMGKGIGYLFH